MSQRHARQAISERIVERDLSTHVGVESRGSLRSAPARPGRAKPAHCYRGPAFGRPGRASSAPTSAARALSVAQQLRAVAPEPEPGGVVVADQLRDDAPEPPA